MRGNVLDEVKARELEGKLRGSSIEGWKIESLIGHGKSAAVFRASGPSGEAALKIFDDELIAKYGDDTQFSRINRELQLIGKSHPNLVQIFGGGVDPITNNHFIVMEYLDGPNLKQCLGEIPADNIGSLISQLADAAKFLETMDFVHRDIKPENIIILEEYTKLLLLDFGVIRPIAGSTLTDDEGIQVFIGTLQYSSPEFLLREEEDSEDGWRALTFYQIGGVLHDLIMRKALFAEFSHPYARLVNAVQHETPAIQSSEVPHYLVELARCCLLKSWPVRLKLVGWSNFDVPERKEASNNSFKQRVTNRGELIRARAIEADNFSDEDQNIVRRKIQMEALEFLKASARTIRAQNAIVPPLRIISNSPSTDGFGIQFENSPASGLPDQLTVFVALTVTEPSARLIELRACGRLKKYSQADLGGIIFKCVFEGTYDAPTLYAILENCIYDLIDQAQQSPTATGEADNGWLITRESS
jgi:eukaryotic-like serine/threonine-protein kinase